MTPSRLISQFPNFLISFALPVLTGLLLVLCFQPFSLSFLVFFAVAPLLYSLCQGGGFGRGWGAGMAFFLPLLTWLRPIPFGNLAWPVCALYMSLYLALFGAVFAWIRRKRGAEVALLAAPLVWVLIEYLRSFGPLAFTWGSAAHALWSATPLLQIADVTGYYGVSFVVLTVNAAWVAWRLNFRRAPDLLAASVLLLGLSIGYGLFRLATVEETAGTPWRVGVAQGSVEELDEAAPTPEARLKGRWQAQLQTLHLRSYLDLSQPALNGGATVLIWPETALPMRLTDPEWTEMRRSLSEFTRKKKVWLLLGSVDSLDWDTIYNTAFIYDDQGRLTDRYHKTHLVVFGEFTPFLEQLPFMRVFNVREVGYTHGEGFHLVRLNGQPIGTPICFESTFSQVVSKFVRQGARLICVITNDAWFDGTAGPAQHAAMAVFRAIENRRWVIQAANTGVTEIITPQGHLRSRLPEAEPGVLIDTVYLRDDATFYLRFSDVFVWLCGVVLVGLVVVQQRPRAD
jgi:apolipoprotein N-acyltransferase